MFASKRAYSPQTQNGFKIPVYMNGYNYSFLNALLYSILFVYLYIFIILIIINSISINSILMIKILENDYPLFRRMIKNYVAWCI